MNEAVHEFSAQARETLADLPGLLDLGGVPDSELHGEIDRRAKLLRSALWQVHRAAIIRHIMRSVRSMTPAELEAYLLDAGRTSWTAAARRMRKARGLDWPTAWDPSIAKMTLLCAHALLGLKPPPQPGAPPESAT